MRDDIPLSYVKPMKPSKTRKVKKEHRDRAKTKKDLKDEEYYIKMKMYLYKYK